MRLPILLGLAVAVQGSSVVATFPIGKVEALGVCEVVPERMACWDMNGASSPALVESLRAALGNGNEVSFRPGRKNRHLVVRRPQQLSVSYRYNPTDSVYQNFSVYGEPTVEFLRVSVPNDTPSLTLQATANVQAPADVDVPLREGAKASVDGWELEVGASQKVSVGKNPPAPVPGRYYSNGTPPAQDYWTVVMGLSGRPGEYVNWGVTPLDASGTPIRYVDAEGKPLTALKALALEPTLQPNNGYNPYPNGEGAPGGKKPKAMAANFAMGGQAPAFRATTNIDPRYVATLRIRASHQETVSFGPFPLDPK